MKTFKETTSLADLMTMATDDMEALIGNDLYNFDSDQWHQKYQGKCDVCMAGSIMANRLGADINESLTPCDFDGDTACKLKAVDDARGGNIKRAYESLGLFYPCDDEGDMCVEGRVGNFYNDDEAHVVIKFWRNEGIPILKEIEGID